MGTFRKKPVKIEAMQYLGLSVDNVSKAERFDDWLCKVQPADRPCRYVGQKLIIPTLEGDMEASPGDWIILGVAGEIYPCKPEIFAATYEAVETELAS